MNLPGSYYISHIDNQIHNSNDKPHKITEHKEWTEISIQDSNGEEIESCCLHTFEDLLRILRS